MHGIVSNNNRKVKTMVLVLLADGFEEIEALTPVDILLRGGVAVKTVGIGSKTVKGSHGISVLCDLDEEEAARCDFDMLILPGGMPGATNLDNSPTVQNLLADAVEGGKRIAAICAAPFILGKRGLLKGKKATCYPGFEEELKGATLTDAGVVTDGKITTAKGMGVALDFALELLSLLKNEAEAERVGQAVMKTEAPVKKPDVTELIGDIYEEVEELCYEADPDPFTTSEEDFPDYVPPSPSLMFANIPETPDLSEEIERKTDLINRVLASFDIQAAVEEVEAGETFSFYKVRPSRTEKPKRIVNLLDDIALNLGSPVRVHAPIAGSSLIGFEIMNDKRYPVMLRSLIESKEFTERTSEATVCLGRKVGGVNVCPDLAKFPHLLIGGESGSGKRTLLNSIALSLIYSAKPSDLRLVLIDTKKDTFNDYTDEAHLLVPVINDLHYALGAIKWLEREMERRYDRFEELDLRNIAQYNEMTEELLDSIDTMPRIVVIINDLKDLKEFNSSVTENYIMRLAQKARAAGIHLVVCTSNASPRIVSGVIKANIPTRIALKCSSIIDSRTILEQTGAEKLAGKGDMLVKTATMTSPARVQAAFVADGDIQAVTDYMKRVGSFRRYDEDVIEEMAAYSREFVSEACEEEEDCRFIPDEEFLSAVEIVLSLNTVSTSLLQRKLSIGYGKAAKYIDIMNDLGIVGEPCGSKPREVLITEKEWLEKLARIQGDNK